MCVQCMAGAVMAGAAATGSRWWLLAKLQRHLTPRRRKALSGVVLTAGVLGAGLVGPTP
jgi:hypothetical protein